MASADKASLSTGKDNIGLDSLFHSYVKLYIKDIHTLEEYPDTPGIYLYNSHAIYKADIMGVVVRAEERRTHFLYALDDGTGVINCCCWKQDNTCTNEGSTDGETTFKDKDWEIFGENLKLFNSIEKSRTGGYQLGEVLHVKGKIKTYRGQRDIGAVYCAPVNNMSVELSRMAELPALYMKFYDNQVQLPSRVLEELRECAEEQQSGSKRHKTILKELKQSILQEISKPNVLNISPNGLAEEEYIKAICEQPCKDVSDNGKLSITSFIENALTQLEGEGILFRDNSTSNSYIIVSRSTHLEKTVKEILRRNTTTSKGAEKGCYYLRVVEDLQRTAYKKIDKSAVIRCLQKLEEQSDIVSTMENYYTVFNI